MGWPTPNDYSDAMQRPLRRFCKPELQRAHAALDSLGKPLVHAGKHLDVYELRGAGGFDRWAIGCFKLEPKGASRRYRLINEHLSKNPTHAVVDTEFHEQGICIKGRWYPITKSRWAKGQPLNTYVRQYLDHPDEIRLLASEWVRLAQQLRAARLAHGGLHAGTVFVAPSQGGSLELRVVDYAEMFVPALASIAPEGTGHPDFQHPRRNDKNHYNADMDRFPQLVTLTALYASAVEGRTLWDRFDSGKNLLFRQEDFQTPGNSPLLQELWRSESNSVRNLAGLLVLACQGSVEDVPCLDQVMDFLRPGTTRAALNRWQVEAINKLFEAGASKPVQNLSLDSPAASRKEGCREWAPNVTDKPIGECDGGLVLHEAVKAGPPPRTTAAPPPLPSLAAAEHPHAQSYHFDAWLPQEVSLVKLQGFVRDVGGKVIRSVPGYIRVHLMDDRELAPSAGPAVMAWLGLVQQPAQAPRVLAVMELNMVHSPTPTRKLTAISLRLSPGPDDEVSPKWKRYCDKIFCELRGYLIGSA